MNFIIPANVFYGIVPCNASTSTANHFSTEKKVVRLHEMALYPYTNPHDFAKLHLEIIAYCMEQKADMRITTHYKLTPFRNSGRITLLHHQDNKYQQIKTR